MSGADLTGLVIVPAFNEGASLPEVTARLLRALPKWDILVVDDGSTDRIPSFSDPRVHIIHLPFNLGIGGAMQAGYRYAAMRGHRIAVQVDGDGQHPAEEVEKLVQVLSESGADMVIGSRFLQPGFYDQSLVRSAGTWVIRSVLLLMTGKRISDCASGFRVVNRRIIRAFSHWYPDDYPEPEVLLHLHQAGCKVVECPVRMLQRVSGRSSITLFSGVHYVVKVVFALLLAPLRRPWPGSVLESE